MMQQRLLAVITATIGVAFVIGVTCPTDPHPFLDRNRAAHWGEYGTVLQRQVGPLRYLGGIQIHYGGCDVYQGADGWWLVGPGRRFTKCLPEEVRAVSDRLIAAECVRRGPPDDLAVD